MTQREWVTELCVDPVWWSKYWEPLLWDRFNQGPATQSVHSRPCHLQPSKTKGGHAHILQGHLVATSGQSNSRSYWTNARNVNVHRLRGKLISVLLLVRKFYETEFLIMKWNLFFLWSICHLSGKKPFITKAQASFGRVYPLKFQFHLTFCSHFDGCLLTHEY